MNVEYCDKIPQLAYKIVGLIHFFIVLFSATLHKG